MKPVTKISRIYFSFGIIVSFLTALTFGKIYRDATEEMLEYQKNGFVHIEPNFINEKILGMHLVYHTRYCFYDGWRPPKHEPIIVVGRWLSSKDKQFSLGLEKRIELYKKFFPDTPYKYNCSCGAVSQYSYDNSPLWKQ